MDNVVTFIQEAKITSFSPQVGFAGDPFEIQGENLEDVENIYFINSFEDKYQASFNIVTPDQNPAKIMGNIPNIDSSIGDYKIRIENSLGYNDWGFFKPYLSVQTNLQNISGDDTTQMYDKLATTSEISSSPTSSEGIQIMSLSYKPVMGGNKLVVQCELSLQSNFWGSAVVALFKDNETTPSKVWNYGLQGLNFGQIAKLTYIADASTVATQTWKVRVGRPTGTYNTVYVNMNSVSSNPYGSGLETSSWLGITEIDN